jgi:bifunctional UDP-N-acetylglucosamine pyrophosphorylase/glucosamine-1-phosphate N-acetyltransferase
MGTETSQGTAVERAQPSTDPAGRIESLILAAGQGTRMKSKLAKVLHPVGGRPMIVRAVDTAWALAGRAPVVVVGHDAPAVMGALGDRARFVHQGALLGTGHAVMQAADLLRDQAGIVLVSYGDMPLLSAATFERLIEVQRATSGAFSMVTIINPNPRGFGRIVRDGGHIRAIVEEAAATEEQKRITELNVGVYAFRAAWLWANLPRIQPNPKKGEYYLTDLVEIAVAAGETVGSVTVDDLDEVIGINTRVDLADAEAALRRRICRAWMLAGVTIRDPATTYIDETAEIGMDTILEPNTQILGRTVIGADCVIGPNSVVVDSHIGDHCVVNASLLESATMEEDVHIGPFGHLRAGAYLCAGVHMGNFGEVKNARLGPGSRMGHFSYIGDAQVGADVNIGAGVITANFDGKNKHRTIIGDHAFIGSDTTLRAPVTIGANSKTGAGAVVTHDVPPDHLAVGVPARARPIEEKAHVLLDQADTLRAGPGSPLPPDNGKG